ncbi:MAG: tetratricopeptide repeat protein [Taibaiella sp.]|nr:tetratricopeptide repeat protein [Taibaiella sp.]
MRYIIKATLLLLLQTLSAGNLHARLEGQARLDSLIKELPRQKEDTNKAKLLKLLSASYRSISSDEVIKYGRHSLELATKLNWKKGIAEGYHNLGINYYYISDYPKAFECDLKALKMYEEIGNKKGIAAITCNISMIYYAQRDYPKALEYLFKALKLDEDGGYKEYAANVTNNIGLMYNLQKDYSKALEYALKALKMYEEIGGNKLGIAAITCNIGLIYYDQKNYIMAVEYYQRDLKMEQEIGNKSGAGIALCNIGATYLDMVNDTTTKGSSVTTTTELPYSKFEPTVTIPKGKAALLAGAIDYLQRALLIDKEIKALSQMQQSYRLLSEAYKLKEDYKQAMEYQANYQALKDSIYSQDNKEQIVKLEMNDQYGRQRLTDSLKTEAREKISALQLQKQRTYTYLGMAGILLLAGFSFFIVKERGKSETARKQSDSLLLNILPGEVAEELKTTGTTTAKHYDDVTVLFTDFVNFTQAGENMSPQGLIDELHECFKMFDEITGKYNIEKIKTIGDAYLAVCGLPTADPKHAENVVRAATEINAFMQDRLGKLGSDRTFAIRIGIHSGSVVAGIVGVKKFAYDIWGDTVNTAARMEQHGEAGRINISETTYELVKDKFSCEYRGKVKVKGKGVMKMYFVS